MVPATWVPWPWRSSGDVSFATKLRLRCKSTLRSWWSRSTPEVDHPCGSEDAGCAAIHADDAPRSFLRGLHGSASARPCLGPNRRNGDDLILFAISDVRVRSAHPLNRLGRCIHREALESEAVDPGHLRAGGLSRAVGFRLRIATRDRALLNTQT